MKEYEKIEIENNNEDQYAREDGIISPFKTKDIKITNVIMTLSNLIDKLDNDEIDLNPDFQRNADLWNQEKKSRLIESVLLKLPLPVFYFDVSNPDKWLVVDGLQRLSTIVDFTIKQKNPLKLKNLEFLTELNGKRYKELERPLTRVINETNIVTYQIEAQTPKEVRYSIFNRINTGGLSLNAQEVRQALNQNGGGVSFLKDISENEIFKKIVGINSKRMLDRELILRYMAFKISSTNDQEFTFDFNNIGEFLDNAMEKLDTLDDKKLEEMKDSFINILTFSEDILGVEHRFSRSIADETKTKTLNRSLFDVLMVIFSEIKNKEKLIKNKEIFKIKFIELLNNNEEFVDSITKGTSGKSAIETRFRIVSDLTKGVISDDR